MDETIKGIIIRSTDYGEKDRILDLFTPRGIVTMTAKSVRAPGAKNIFE